MTVCAARGFNTDQHPGGFAEDSKGTRVENVFECKMCGQCCQGCGGILLPPRDLARLARFLNLDEAETAREYGERSGGKLKVRQGADGYCVLFRQGIGCAVHVAKPDVCRAWPFFRGNLADPVSFAMAREYCPGISKSASFAEFQRQGLAWLVQERLLGHAGPNAPNALKVDDLRRMD